jgi:uncharacterized repeat protein (TIGR03803 family)
LRTVSGGAAGAGTVFRLDANGSFTTLHVFGNSSFDGAHPAARLLEASDGNLYGTTSSGGAAGAGIVFKMDVSGTLTPMHVPL